MEELIVTIDPKKHLIQTNFDDIKSELSTMMAEYKGIIIDESTVKESKKDLAELRKVRTEIENKRKEIKREWEAPYEQFKEKCDELLKLIDEPIEEINKQLTQIDLERILKKREHLNELYEEHIGDYKDYLSFDSIYKKQWDNVSYKDSDVIYDISEAVVKVRSDLEIIKGLGSDIEPELIEVYKKNGNNLSVAMQRFQQYMELKTKIQSTQPAAPAEPKVEPTSMGTLNDMVELTKTVKIIVSKADLQLALNALDFNDIKYQVVEN